MKFKKSVFMFFLAGLIFTACKKDYYKDSGVHDGTFSGTIYDYLQTRPELFDTLVQVIDIADMRDVLDNENKQVTFFAPPSSTIFRAVKGLNKYLYSSGKDTVVYLTQIKKEAWKELLSLYVFEGKYMLKDYAQLDTIDLNAFGGQGYESYSFDGNEGRPMNIGVIFNDASGVKYAGYRQLWLSYIADLSDQKGSMLNVPVASSNIEPINSALHVLTFRNHSFGFATDNFIRITTSKGIDPLPEEESL